MGCMDDVKPVVLVTRATGAGESVVRALLGRGRFAVRALTRKPRSERARALAALGAQPAPGDFDDLASLTLALAGCCAVAAVFARADDSRQLRLLIDAAADAGVAHVIVSAPAAADLEDCTAYARELGMSLTTVLLESADDVATAVEQRLGFSSRPVPAA